jgi:hypothetical protein
MLTFTRHARVLDLLQPFFEEVDPPMQGAKAAAAAAPQPAPTRAPIRACSMQRRKFTMLQFAATAVGVLLMAGLALFPVAKVAAAPRPNTG